MLALLQAEALAIHFQNVHMVSEPVEQSAGQPFWHDLILPLRQISKYITIIYGNYFIRQ